jgi:hypothetical protein
MKYMLFLYADPAKDPVPGTPEFDAMMAAFFALGEKMKGRATILAGEGLKAVATAKTLRIRSGQHATTDGPFAETHEHLGGFYLIEAATLEDAMAFAAEVPVAAYGSVEVRPVEIYE